MLNKSDILSCVSKKNFCVVENFIEKRLLNSARNEYFSFLKESTIHPQGEKFSPTDLYLRPWRKQAIGSRNGSGEPYSQVLQTTYFHGSNKEFPALMEIFGRMISLRNSWTNMRVDYGNDLIGDDFWNACRIHHYPQGGGHMAGHRDTLFPSLLKNFEIPFLQVLVTMSTRGSDFYSGGGYVIDGDGRKVFIESDGAAGSIVFFNGSTVHGVEDVDPTQLLDFSSEKGRISLLVNLYANQNKSL
jgi:hypothetical protein